MLERRPSHDDLIDHLVRSTALQRGEAARVILDVLAYFDETTEDYVRRRHREMQAGGAVNAEIFERIAAELPYRAVAPPEALAPAAAPHRLRIGAVRADHAIRRGRDCHVRNRRLHRKA